MEVAPHLFRRVAVMTGTPDLRLRPGGGVVVGEVGPA